MLKKTTQSAPRIAEHRPRLGRGLAALLGENQNGSQTSVDAPDIKHVPIEFIRSNSRNPRVRFDDAELEELSASIKQCGIIQPIIVRLVPGVLNAYEIVAGERRWRAAQRAGQHTVPVICMQIADREALEISIVENVQRTNLNALEEAKGYAQLAAEYGYSHTEIGQAIGKSRSHVANTVRLLTLPEHSQNLLRSGAISAGHARALLTTNQPDALADEIVAKGLTVRDAEKLKDDAQSAPLRKNTVEQSDPEVSDLVRKLSTALGVETSLVRNKRSWTLALKCKNSDQMEFICDKLLKA